MRPLPQSSFLRILLIFVLVLLVFTLWSTRREERRVILTEERMLTVFFPSWVRLGNNIFIMLSWYGMAKKLNRIPVIQSEKNFNYVEEFNRKTLARIFPSIAAKFRRLSDNSIPMKTVNGTRKCCEYDDPAKYDDPNIQHLHIKGAFYQSWKYIQDYRDELMESFKPDKELVANVSKILPESRKNDFLVCVHTRRSDFIGYGFEYSTKLFTRLSTDHIVRKFQKMNPNKKISVFATGEDRKWIKEIYNGSLSDDKIYKVQYEVTHSNLPPLEDLVFTWLHCNSVFMSAARSTFGWWMAYMIREKENVYYAGIPKDKNSFTKEGVMNMDDYNPPYWNELQFDEDFVHEMKR